MNWKRLCHLIDFGSGFVNVDRRGRCTGADSESRETFKPILNTFTVDSVHSKHSAVGTLSGLAVCLVLFPDSRQWQNGCLFLIR